MARHIWITVLISTILRPASALDCYDCRNVADTSTCNRTITCSGNESCFMEVSTLVSSEKTYILSCKDNGQCHAHSSSSPLIGRSVYSDTTKRDASCNECCSTSLCNKALCNHPRPKTCTDDPSVDCAKMDSIFNVCADVHKAKLVCPRFCNLCNVVDGNWNWWSSWSRCDVTCANGTQTRQRTCTDPAPQNGGLDCMGVGTESKTCDLDRCPIHGGWSLWAVWGSCSVTCDVGMQRRDRSCDNPYPSLGGDHCFGDGRDDRICYVSACSDGGWSDWQSWSSCSVSCGGGVQTRNRACNNPLPSLLGRYCDGTPQDFVSCNNGLCTGPEIQFIVGMPSMFNCFPRGFSGSGCQVTFRSYISPPNPHFNLQTSRFTAFKSGSYWFKWNFTLNRTSSCTNMKCDFIHNEHVVSTISMDSAQTQVISATSLYLSINDTVHIDSCICIYNAQQVQLAAHSFLL